MELISAAAGPLASLFLLGLLLFLLYYKIFKNRIENKTGLYLLVIMLSVISMALVLLVFMLLLVNYGMIRPPSA